MNPVNILVRRLNCSLFIQFRGKRREVEFPDVHAPNSGKFRRLVHFPKEYTISPLRVTNLAGRDPETGRVVVSGWGGGIKHKYHWIHWKRDGPADGPPLEEKVIAVMDDGCRTAKVALVAGGTSMKYYLATSNMKGGDIIRTSKHIPRNPVLPKEGDAFPLGALPLGTIVCCVEKIPNLGGFYCHSAGTCATLIQRDPAAGRVVIRLPSKLEVSLLHDCMATVGQISNVEHDSTPIGSAQRARELGHRPRSGLWHRKDGRFGRKIRAPPPVHFVNPAPPSSEAFPPTTIKLTYDTDMHYHSPLHPRYKLY